MKNSFTGIGFSLPMHPYLGKEDQERIVELLMGA